MVDAKAPRLDARHVWMRGLFALMASASPLAMAPAASAQGQGASHDAARATINYNIPAQDLSSALVEFARQSGLQIIYPHDELRSMRAPTLSGAYRPDEALRRLLSQTSFVASVDDAGVIRLENTARPQRIRAEAQDPSAPLAVGRIDDAGAQDGVGADTAADEEIVVTGTRIRGAHPAGANLTTLDRGDIEESGRSTIQDVLRALPQVFPGSQNEVTQLNSIAGGANIGFGATVDLRGLGADSTLTLVNGRRLAPAGFGNFVDISSIPLAAVERIEVLADGASATYGSDAIGGVVNVILRRDFDGAETSVRFGGATGGGLGERVFSHVSGWNWNAGQFTAGYEYRLRDRLATEDRPFSASTDLRPLGGDDFSRNLSNPGNITRIGTTNVTIAIPSGQDGTSLSESDLLVGQVNLQNGNLFADLAPRQERHSLFGSLRFEVGAVEFFADVFASRRESEMHDAQLTANLTVPQTNAYRQLNNLFPGQGNLTIAYSFANDLGPIRYDTQSDTISALGGFAFDLAGEWRAEATASASQHEDHVRFSNGLDSSSLAPFLASSSLDTAFNPFSDGGNSPEAVLAGIRQHTASDNLSELTAFGVKADGPLFDLPGGAVRMAIGAERRLEEFKITRTRFNAAGVGSPILPAQAPSERTTEAYFVEFFAPLLADLPLIERLDLSLSARHEASDSYEAATTPKVGLYWALSPDIALRGTWGTSFKAPRFDQLYLTTTAAYSIATPAQDPFATNGSTGALLLGGGNPNLEPEDAETWTAGFEFEPHWFEGFSTRATYFDIDFANRIGAAGDVLTAIRNPVSFAQVLIRDPTPEQIAHYQSLTPFINGTLPPDGVELIYDGRLVNVSSQRVRGVDIDLSYAFETDIGQFRLFAGGSHLLEFSRTPLPNTPAIEQVDTLYNPIDWRARAGMSWTSPSWRASFTTNYADDYHDTISAPRRRVASWTTYDLQIGHVLSGATIEDDPRTELTLSVQNLTDEDPPFVNNTLGLGFDAVNSSPAGRLVSVELRRRW